MSGQPTCALKPWAAALATAPLMDFRDDDDRKGIAVELAEAIANELNDATGLTLTDDGARKFKIGVINIVAFRINELAGVVPMRGEISLMVTEIEDIAKQAWKLDKSLAELNPRTAHYFKAFYDCSEGVLDGGPPSIFKLRLGLNQISAVAEVRLKELRAQHEAARTSAARVYDRISTLYSETFGKPGVSRGVGSRKSADGPFVRFVSFVEHRTNPLDEPPLRGEGVASARKRLRKRVVAST